MAYEHDEAAFDVSELFPSLNDSDLYSDLYSDLGEDAYYCKACGQIEHILRQVLPPILLLIGIPGNILTLICMNTLSTEAFPLCGYLCLLAGLDTVLLFVEMGNDWINFLSSQNMINGVTTSSDTMCKLYNFSQNLIVHHDVWILVSFLIECNVLLHYPDKIRYITSRRVLDTLAFISVLLICANCHYFWTYGINKVQIPFGGAQTMSFCQFQTRTLDGQLIPGPSVTGVLWTTLHKVLATILPSLVFLILLILYIRRRRSYKAKDYTDDLTEFIQERQSINRDNQTNGLPYDRHGVQLNAAFICELSWRTFPALCAMFLLCHVPDLVHETLEQKYGHLGSPDLWSLTGVLCYMARSVTYSCKIVVFAVTSSVFRKTLKTILLKKWSTLREGCRMPAIPEDDESRPKSTVPEVRLDSDCASRPSSYSRI